MENGAEQNDVIEYTRQSNTSKSTYYGCYVRLVDSVPEGYINKTAKTPFLEVALIKSKNGSFDNIEQVPLEEILYFYRVGKSGLE